MAAASSELLPQPQPQDDEQLTAIGGSGGTASGTGRSGGGGKHRYGPQRLTGSETGGTGGGRGGGSGTVSSSVLERDTNGEQLTKPAVGRSSSRSYCSSQKVEEGQEEELVSSVNHYKHHKKQWQRGVEQLTKGTDYNSEQLNVDNSRTDIDDEGIRKVTASTADNGDCPLKGRMNSSINSSSINSSVSSTKQVGTAPCITNMDMVVMAKVVTRTTVKQCDHGNGRGVETQEGEDLEETGHSSSCSSRSSLHNGRHSNHICGSRERLCCTPEARAGDVAFESHGVERAAQGEVGRAAQSKGEQVTVVKATTTTRAAQGASIKTNGAAHGAPHCVTKTEVPTGGNCSLSGAELDGGTHGQPLSLSIKDIESQERAMKTVTKRLRAAQSKEADRNGADIITEVGGLTYASLQPVKKVPTDIATRETRPICKIADTYSLSIDGISGTTINNYPQSINMIGKGRDIDSQSIDMIPATTVNSDQQSAKGIVTTGADVSYSEQVKGTNSNSEASNSDSEPVKGLQVDSETVKDLNVIQPGEGHVTQSPSVNTTTTSMDIHRLGAEGGSTPPPLDTQMAIHALPGGAPSPLQAPVGSIPDRHQPPPPPGWGESSDQSGPAPVGGVGGDGGVSERVNTAVGGGSSSSRSSGGRRHAPSTGEVVNVKMIQPGIGSVSVTGVKTREAAQRNLDTILQRIMTQGKRHGGGGGRDSSPDLHLTPARGHPNDYMGKPGACMDVPQGHQRVWRGDVGCTKLTDPSPFPAHNQSWIYGVNGGGFIHNSGIGLPSQNGTDEVLDYSLNGRESQTNGDSLKGIGKPTKVTPSDGIVTAHARRKRGGSGSTERRGGGKKPRGARSRGRVSTSGGGVKQSVNSSGCNSTPDPISNRAADTHPALPALPLHTQADHAEPGGAGENSPSSCPPSGDSAEVPGGTAGWQHFASRLERINRLKEDLRQKEREVELIRKARQDPGLKGH